MLDQLQTQIAGLKAQITGPYCTDPKWKQLDGTRAAAGCKQEPTGKLCGTDKRRYFAARRKRKPVEGCTDTDQKGQEQIDQGRAELAAGEKELAAAGKQLDEAKKELDKGKNRSKRTGADTKGTGRDGCQSRKA